MIAETLAGRDGRGSAAPRSAGGREDRRELGGVERGPAHEAAVDARAGRRARARLPASPSRRRGSGWTPPTAAPHRAPERVPEDGVRLGGQVRASRRGPSRSPRPARTRGRAPPGGAESRRAPSAARSGPRPSGRRRARPASRRRSRAGAIPASTRRSIFRARSASVSPWRAPLAVADEAARDAEVLQLEAETSPVNAPSFSA